MLGVCLVCNIREEYQGCVYRNAYFLYKRFSSNLFKIIELNDCMKDGVYDGMESNVKNKIKKLFVCVLKQFLKYDIT